MYVGFKYLENMYDWVNKETLWQVQRMYYVGGNLWNQIKITYINSLACVKVKGGKSE